MEKDRLKHIHDRRPVTEAPIITKPQPSMILPHINSSAAMGNLGRCYEKGAL